MLTSVEYLFKKKRQRIAPFKVKYLPTYGNVIPLRTPLIGE